MKTRDLNFDPADPHRHRDELIALVEAIMSCDGSEDEITAMLTRVECGVADPNVCDLIFHPPGGVELSAAQVVDKALACKPYIL